MMIDGLNFDQIHCKLIRVGSKYFRRVAIYFSSLPIYFLCNCVVSFLGLGSLLHVVEVSGVNLGLF